MGHQAQDIALLITYAGDVVDGSVRISVFRSFFLFIHISENYLLVSLQFWNLFPIEIVTSLIVRDWDFQYLSCIGPFREGRARGFDPQPSPGASEAKSTIAQYSSW